MKKRDTGWPQARQHSLYGVKAREGPGISEAGGGDKGRTSLVVTGSTLSGGKTGDTPGKSSMA